MMRRVVMVSAIAALSACESQAVGSFQAFLGGAYNVPTTLHLRQTGEEMGAARNKSGSAPGIRTPV